MRQVFSSLRLENVEGVAALLNEHGIETWISQSRSYKGNRRRTFSYADNAKDKPTPAAVWVVHAEAQPKARALLREAGLMETTRTSYLPEHASAPPPVTRGPVNHAARIRMVMLAAVVVLATFTSARQCNSPGSVAPPSQPPAPVQTPDEDIERHIVPVDTSLR